MAKTGSRLRDQKENKSLKLTVGEKIILLLPVCPVLFSDMF